MKMVTSAKFKREQNSAWEEGIAIGMDTGDIDIIIDSKGKAVDNVWDYRVNSFKGLFWFDLTNNFFANKYK